MRDPVVEKAKSLYDVERLLDVDELLKDEVGDDEWVSRVKREGQGAATIYETLTKESDFLLSTNAQGVEVCYRPEATTRFASIRVSLDLEASLATVMTVANEVELLGQFMPSFLGFEAKRLKQISRFRQLVLMRVKMPFPFKPRECIIDAIGVDALDRKNPGGVMIVVRSPEKEEFPDVDWPEETDDYVRARVLIAGALITPTSDATCTFSNVVNIDPQLDFLPGWLFNWVNRRLVWYAFSAFRNKARQIQEEGLPEDYKEARLKKRYIYDELDRRLSWCK